MNINKNKLRMSQFSKTIIFNIFSWEPREIASQRGPKKSSNKMCVITATLFHFFHSQLKLSTKTGCLSSEKAQKLLLLNIKTGRIFLYFIFFSVQFKIGQTFKRNLIGIFGINCWCLSRWPESSERCIPFKVKLFSFFLLRFRQVHVCLSHSLTGNRLNDGQITRNQTDVKCVNTLMLWDEWETVPGKEM
jgi:hypothetical protein